jgi:hypothetical protein
MKAEAVLYYLSGMALPAAIYFFSHLNSKTKKTEKDTSEYGEHIQRISGQVPTAKNTDQCNTENPGDQDGGRTGGC